MKRMSNVSKVTSDMGWIQLKWAVGFLGIMLVVQIIRTARMNFFGGSDVDSYYMSVLIAANIFMFVIGIISINFLPVYVQNGVTRTAYFKGTLLASIGLSAIIPILTLGLSLAERFIFGTIANIQIRDTTDINSVGADMEVATGSGDMIGEVIGNIVSHTVQAFILTPYVDPGSNWMLALGTFAGTIFTYYVLGWLISASFHRYGSVGGIGFILIAIVILMLADTLQRVSLDLPVFGWFTALASWPVSVTVLGLFVLILLSIWVIRLLTKRVPIKM